MGSLVDITDNFEELNRFIIIGDTPTEAFLEKFVGYLGGFIVLAIGLVRWIPEQSTEQKKIEATNLRLARIIEDSINEIFVFNAETLKFHEVNASACRNTGYTVEEMAELTPLDLKPEFTLEQFEDMIAPLRSGEQDHIRLQTIHRRKDGSHYDVEIVLQQIKNDKQSVFAAIIEDITER